MVVQDLPQLVNNILRSGRPACRQTGNPGENHNPLCNALSIEGVICIIEL